MINNSSIKQQAILTARQYIEKKPVYLDTETTGLTNQDEIVEIAIIDHDGSTLFEELVKPRKAIPIEAQNIHGITDAMVANARTFPVMWQSIRPKLINRQVGIYNTEFDLRMMQQSYEIYKLSWREKINAFDILVLYAQFFGEWDPRYRRYRYQSLEKAGKQCNILLPNSHRAKDDALLTRELLHYMANSEA